MAKELTTVNGHHRLDLGEEMVPQKLSAIGGNCRLELGENMVPQVLPSIDRHGGPIKAEEALNVDDSGLVLRTGEGRAINAKGCDGR